MTLQCALFPQVQNCKDCVPQTKKFTPLGGAKVLHILLASCPPTRQGTAAGRSEQKALRSYPASTSTKQVNLAITPSSCSSSVKPPRHLSVTCRPTLHPQYLGIANLFAFAKSAIIHTSFTTYLDGKLSTRGLFLASRRFFAFTKCMPSSTAPPKNLTRYGNSKVFVPVDRRHPHLVTKTYRNG
jgi:hypothetical protein